MPLIRLSVTVELAITLQLVQLAVPVAFPVFTLSSLASCIFHLYLGSASYAQWVSEATIF